MLGSHALKLLPRIAGVVGVQHTAIIAHDNSLAASIHAASAVVDTLLFIERHTDDDDLVQILEHAGEQGAPRRIAAVGRVANQATVADSVAVEWVIRPEIRRLRSGSLHARLYTVDVVEGNRRHRVLRLPTDVLAEDGLDVVVNTEKHGPAPVAQDRARRACRTRVGAHGEARKVLRVGDHRGWGHLCPHPVQGAQVGHLQAEDRAEVGEHVVAVVDDAPPAKVLLVGTL